MSSGITLGEVGDAGAGGLAAALRAAEGDGLAGDDRGREMADVGRVGVHHPAHDLLVGADVGRGHVGVRPEEVDHFLHVAAGEMLEFGLGELLGIDDHAALGAAVGQADERTFPAHPHRERGDLADGDVLVEADAALGRAGREVVLDPIAFEDRDRSIVAVDRAGDGDRPFRQQQAVAFVHRDREMIGDHPELVHRHLENRTGIDGHRSLPWSCCQELRLPQPVRAMRHADDAFGRS